VEAVPLTKNAAEEIERLGEAVQDRLAGRL